MSTIYKVQTIFTGPVGSPWLATNYLIAGGGLLVADAVAGVGGLWDDLKGLIKNNVSWTVQGQVDVIDVASGQPTSIASATPVTGTGTTSGDALPPATQGLLRWNTGFFISGRQVKGRTFVPGMTSSATTNGAPSTSALSTMQTAMTNYAGLTLATPCIYSRVNHTTADISGGSPWTEYAVLRSRRD